MSDIKASTKLKDRGQPRRSTATKDMRGKKFGALTGISKIENEKQGAHWIFLCDCGAKVIRSGGAVRGSSGRGGIPSCGCKSREKQKRHGMAGRGIYFVWTGMLGRCRNKANLAWDNYGGRGITVCEEWLDFSAFMLDMGPSYQPGLTLDRIDNDKGYYKENCRWATKKEQARNRRTNTHISTPDGSMVIALASERYGIRYRTILARIKAGWSHHDAVLTPVSKTGRTRQK